MTAEQETGTSATAHAGFSKVQVGGLSMRKALAGLLCLMMIVVVGCGGPAGQSAVNSENQPVKPFEDKNLNLTTGKIQIKVANPEGKGPFPVIVLLHGYSQKVDDHYVEAMSYLAKRNFIVVAPSLSFGTMNSASYKVSEIIDQVAKWPRVKSEQMGVWGFSMGAGAALLTADKNAKVKAVVACGAPYSELDQSIIVPLAAPVLILHGALDDIEIAKRYENKRKELNRPVQVNYTEKGHSWEIEPEIAKTADFFRDTLK